MMTLLPLSAFAAADRFASVASIDKTSVAANGSDTIKVTVYTYNSDNSIAGSTKVYFASNRTTETFAADSGTFDGTLQYVITDVTTGKASFKVKSNVPGAAKIALGLPDAGKTIIEQYLYGGSGAPSAEDAKILQNGVFDVTFTAPAAKTLEVLTIDKNDGSAGTSGDPYNDATVNGNSVDYYEISFKLSAENNAPVRDTTVEFTASKPEISFSKTSIVTDAAGIAKVKVFASKPGKYSIKGKSGDVEKEVYVNFNANDLYNIELISDNNQLIAKDADKEFKFKLLDVNGNQVKVSGLTNKDGVDISTAPVNLAAGNLGLKFEATQRPTDAAMDEKIYQNTSETTDYLFKSEDTTGYLVMKIFGKELDKEGDYTIKAYFDSGKYVDLKFTVKKQGTPTKLTVEYKPSVVPIGATVPAPTVKRWDDAGVSKQITTNLQFVASDTRAIKNLNAATGAFDTVNVDEKYAGEKTITVIDKDKNLSATATITVMKQASGLQLTGPAGVTEVGKDAVITAQLLDADGKPVALGSKVPGGNDISDVTASYYIVSKPADAIVSNSTDSEIVKNIKEKGSATLKISSNKAGTVVAQVVITATDGANDISFTNSITLEFGAPKVVVGAKSVTMFIGATGYVQDGAPKVTDVAPFIENGRTFVAVRPVADAFGAEIGWDAATQTVTLTRSDRTVTIVIGSNTITVVKGGVTSTVTADVAAQIKNGRTVLPFRAVGEAFDATVGYDAATQAVSYTQ
jgi:hypothetical protein